MLGAYIELHEEVFQHTKTRRLTRALGLKVPKDIPQIIGHLAMLWAWSASATDEGSLNGYDADDISDAAGWRDDPQKFFSALVDSGFVDYDGSTYSIHDWDINIGRIAKRQQKERVRNREKQRRRRSRLKADQPVEPSKAALDFSAEIPDSNWYKVVQCYEANIGLLPMGAGLDTLMSFYEDLGAEVVCKAITATSQENPSNPWQYLKAVLNKWISNGVDSPEKAEAFQKTFERQKSSARKVPEAAKPKYRPATIAELEGELPD